MNQDFVDTIPVSPSRFIGLDIQGRYPEASVPDDMECFEGVFSAIPYALALWAVIAFAAVAVFY